MEQQQQACVHMAAPELPSSQGAGISVCLTGATGYVAGELSLSGLITAAAQLVAPVESGPKQVELHYMCNKCCGSALWLMFSCFAGHIVQHLLQRGYTVHATCRDPRNRKSVAHLLALPHAAERLKLFPADLTVPGSFMQAMEGCKYVIHTASPYALEVPPGQVGHVHAHERFGDQLQQAH
jgi:hypothetical protein